MARKPSKTTLTSIEKSVIKALLVEGWRNQDVQVLINTGRSASINFGRISTIKGDNTIVPASKQQVEAFRRKKLLFDHVTGLCPFDDERLVRAREAMILAVELFNTPRIAFKAGVFSMLANVAWTYLLHQYYVSKGVPIIKDGFSLLLSQMIAREDVPLSKGCKQNLVALKEIRDVVEHRTIGSFDSKWLPLFQSTCLNFEKVITELFGVKLTLGHDLGFSLQFAKLTTEEISTLQGFDLPEHIAALDASLAAKLKDGEADDLEYQFKVIYTLTNASKAKAHFQFVQPDSAEGKEIQNVLIKYKPLDEIYPLKPSEVSKLISEKSGRKFTLDKHQRAWKMFKVRPKGDAGNPSATDIKYCVYHVPYKAYTYSKIWVDFLVEKIADEAVWQQLSTFKD
ncbi:hypothetical protein ASD79_05445 [Caulobacter sp. Root655]|uniref:DUF3644 domain-containing protein n=1 Tax=Caulobacter sp. Root655 TaxID=1736578 RepID=UPI0006F95475|nr:DUF3644 domain-containing protein [Caulobacter sp. Root655]KRA61564.1 hypothetical protein ASD79_05445 [Caulobacter sp. Root655]